MARRTFILSSGCSYTELVIGNGANIRIVSGTIFELNYGQN
jgi:hypothetical protein